MRSLSAVPTALLFGIAAVIVVQLSLQVAAIVSLVRTPAERVSIGGRKWVWALIIVLGELLGPILYFLVGRTTAPAVEPLTASPVAERAASAVDSLYGTAPDGPAATASRRIRLAETAARRRTCPVSSSAHRVPSQTSQPCVLV